MILDMADQDARFVHCEMLLAAEGRLAGTSCLLPHTHRPCPHSPPSLALPHAAPPPTPTAPPQNACPACGRCLCGTWQRWEAPGRWTMEMQGGSGTAQLGRSGGGGSSGGGGTGNRGGSSNSGSSSGSGSGGGEDPRLARRSPRPPALHPAADVALAPSACLLRQLPLSLRRPESKF